MEVYLRLTAGELSAIKRMAVREIVEGETEAERKGMLELLLKLEKDVSTVEQVDGYVKASPLFKALENLGYFDYEEVTNDSTFYDLVCMVEGLDVQGFKELGEEMNKKCPNSGTK